MSLSILEDHSPYYIIFEHDGSDEIVSIASKFRGDNWKRDAKFTHERLDNPTALSIISRIPAHDELELWKQRVSLFITQPGSRYNAHKDGFTVRFGINYAVEILDDKCITSWYDDETILTDGAVKYSEPPHYPSREALGFRKKERTPAKVWTMKPGQVVLFNTDIFHAWDNSASTNHRVILTIRSTSPDIFFDDAKTILFGQLK